jgi:hypothetical protein
MATYRCGVVLIAGLLLMGSSAVRAQQPSSTTPLTYDQMMQQEQTAKAQKDAEAAKHAKKGKHADADAAAPVATSTPAAAATPAATPVAEPAAVAATPAAAPATAATPTAVSATPADAAAATPGAAETPAAGAAAGADVPPGAPATATDPLKPVKLEKGKGKQKVKKEKPPKLVPVEIVHGKLTVDGLIAKAGLNFQIIDLKYFYIWVPGMGTAIVSNQPFAGATLQGGALDGSTLLVTVDGHRLELSCDQPLLVTKDVKKEEDKEEKDAARLKEVKADKKPNKKDKPVAMYVAIDRNWQKPSGYPEFGYGDLTKAPYSWPGTLADLSPGSKAPPLPDNLKQHPESVKLCGKGGDPNACREVAVPLVLGKNS